MICQTARAVLRNKRRTRGVWYGPLNTRQAHAGGMHLSVLPTDLPGSQPAPGKLQRRNGESAACTDRQPSLRSVTLGDTTQPDPASGQQHVGGYDHHGQVLPAAHHPHRQVGIRVSSACGRCTCSWQAQAIVADLHGRLATTPAWLGGSKVPGETQRDRA